MSHEQSGVEGRLERYEHVASGFVAPRHVDVWLPPGYDAAPDRRYPVLYAHDGQNLFLPELSFTGVDWGLDEAMMRVAARDSSRACLVVGVWNTPARIAEYMPQKPLEASPTPRFMERFVETHGQTPCSDAYLRFLVEELKPFIDGAYRTLSGPEHTFIMGSSMGGLISLYALCEYPGTFAGAACLSTSWTVGGRVMIPYLERALPAPQTHRVYFDYGVEAHIGKYETYQRQVDVRMAAAGYVRHVNWTTQRFPGAEHSEGAWRSRVDIPLLFLLARGRSF